VSGVQIAGARVVITGAGSGIGEATALRCARAGAAEVACVDIDADAAEATAAACEEAGAGVGGTAWTCDVADAAAVQALSDDIETRRGPVDVVVNNAGVGVGGPFLEAGVEDWDWLIGINLNGVAYGCRAFGGPMVRRGRGHVVNVASAAAFVMSRDMAAYCASKAAVLALSRCLRADWSGTGVGVSAICPGVINTPIPGNSRMVGAMADRQERIVKAFRRGHAPDLVARAIVRAVQRDQAVVPVGFEAEIAHRLMPFVPGRVQHFAAKTQLGRFI
jgi:NAD(P)-dependent dehydrogenase (short-subunit alcohol dehydrogenase family)